ncbi:electron transport complex subunit RsxB [Clostridium saccharoperbutylacetonicum]|nr:electron transport complex subunit RsxB [Clostridium saccharoperbutylacetonicum]
MKRLKEDVMKVLYFTATGNNLYVGKKIGGESYSIPKLMKQGQFEFEDEKVGIVFPSYYGGVPRIVEEFLDKVKLKSKYIFAVVSFGSFSGAVIPELLEIGKRNQIQFSYINEILMVDNYLPVFDMDKEMRKEPKKNIEESLAQITKDIQAKKVYIKRHTAVIRFIEAIIKKFHSSTRANLEYDKNFYAEDACNSCKICEKVCPVNNINVDTKPVYKGNCEHCLACINHCPQNAIRLKGERSKTRFINKNIALKEIIDSNS